jgi:hypothetical protein
MNRISGDTFAANYLQTRATSGETLATGSKHTSEEITYKGSSFNGGGEEFQINKGFRNRGAAVKADLF